MVTVKVKRRIDDSIDSIEVSGHAGSGPYGHDLVCAAVSAITFGTYNAIEALCNEQLPLTLDEDGGYFFVSIPSQFKGKTQENIQLLLEAMIVSLQTIEASYKENIKVTTMR